MEAILAGRIDVKEQPQPDPWQTVQRILARRREYGITRIGSITELDWAGIPVVQVVRPESRSVSVSQGKGLNFQLAAISGVMESLEGWASERISSDRVMFAPLASTRRPELWSHLRDEREDHPLSWIDGIDLLSGDATQVPLALVDTAYTVPSPHPHWIARDTCGLAASTSLQGAVAHAVFEILERDARCAALKRPHFFDRYQIDSRSLPSSGQAGKIVRRLWQAGFSVGLWSIPSDHGLPIYWCHIMENGEKPPFAPLPAEGFGCDLSHDRALTKALLEACQSRLGVISAAREDIRRELYSYYDTKELSAWRRQLELGGNPYPSDDFELIQKRLALRELVDALQAAGARAAIVVHLHSDETVPLHIVRVVAPPLKTNPEVASAL
ncbi:YcaO-like family protein [Rhizobium leguminosarum bv. trifolii]|nr:YcaO-like family protein [Rhizobium leguminosarum bv. trifolii]